jgi:uncharacterized protein YgbK (DUF1537 family)
MAILGVIADDFTGAGDIASFLVKGGMSTIMLTDFAGCRPGRKIADQVKTADAAVIALKSRTQETAAAVKDSLEAIRCLQDWGCAHFYIKYCSTFDSTSEGNIGPVCDAVMDELGCAQALLCPALPVNGRIVKGGKLYVNGVLLEESPMKDHPLTPMKESDLALLMTAQSRYSSIKIGRLTGTEAAGNWSLSDGTTKQYLIPDCTDNNDLKKIASVFGNEKLITGGSGLAEFLGSILRKDSTLAASVSTAIETAASGHTFLLAGSCSMATRVQIADYRAAGGYAIKLSVEDISNGTLDIDKLVADILLRLSTESVLVYTSDAPERTREIQHTDSAISSKIEQIMGVLAQKIRDHGCRKIVVAGGETSGAVTQALSVHAVRIGDSIAPGVPVMVPLDGNGLKLVLKSGNFGQPNFFRKAIAAL